MDGHLRANQAFGSAVGSGFSTIRPVTLMKKEKEDQRNHSAFREQMGNYKKLRQEHRKIMMELEAKLEKEMENHQRNLQHELHRQRKKHEEDRHKQARKRHAHIEKISKDDELEGKLEQKAIELIWRCRCHGLINRTSMNVIFITLTLHRHNFNFQFS